MQAGQPVSGRTSMVKISSSKSRRLPSSQATVHWVPEIWVTTASPVLLERVVRLQVGSPESSSLKKITWQPPMIFWVVVKDCPALGL